MPLLWEELTGLGVSFARCGVFIVDDAAQRVDAYLTNPQGASLGALRLAFGSHAHVGRLVEHWQAQAPHTEQWDQPTFQRWVHFLQEQGQSIEPQQYQDAEAAPEALTLQFAPFVQGMLYVGSVTPLPAEDVVLVQELATAFSVAYARYLDFQRLEAQNIQIQEATRHKSAFLASMSHDLRSPMNAIIGFTRLLLRRTTDHLDEREQRNLRNIETSSGNLLNLINDILDLSRIEAGHIEVDVQPVDVCRLADECADALESIVKTGVELRRELSDVPEIRTDPDRLRQVVMNLLGNATR